MTLGAQPWKGQPAGRIIDVGEEAGGVARAPLVLKGVWGKLPHAVGVTGREAAARGAKPLWGGR